MRRTVLLLTVTGFLQACATAPSAPPVVQTCPTIPMLELDVPERAFQEEMRLFLQGTLPTQPGLKPPSNGAWPSTTK